MKNEGWVKMYRSLTDNWLWEDKPFARGQAWIDLLFLANHSEQKTFIDGNLEKIERGQIITSIRKLCDRWGWSNTKVRKFLKILESDSMVSIKNDTKKTVITLVNYSVYQDFENEKTTQKRQQNDTETSQKHTNKNVKNDNNINNNNNIKRFAPPDYEQVSRYCRQRNNGIDPEEFVDYYTAKDWMVGKSKMKDWKAAVRNWERNQAKKNAKQKSKVTNLAHLECDRDYDFGALERQLFEKQMTG